MRLLFQKHLIVKHLNGLVEKTSTSKKTGEKNSEFYSNIVSILNSFDVKKWAAKNLSHLRLKLSSSIFRINFIF